MPKSVSETSSDKSCTTFSAKDGARQVAGLVFPDTGKLERVGGVSQNLPTPSGINVRALGFLEEVDDGLVGGTELQERLNGSSLSFAERNQTSGHHSVR